MPFNKNFSIELASNCSRVGLRWDNKKETFQLAIGNSDITISKEEFLVMREAFDKIYDLKIVKHY